MYLCSGKLFFSFGIFIIILVDCAVCECVESTACSCVQENGQGYDLTSLTNRGPFVNDQHNFTFQPCKDVNLTFVGSKINSSQCNSSSICMMSQGNESISLGSVNDIKWKLPVVKGGEAQLIFRHSTYETRIKLLCCSTCTESKLVTSSGSNNPYELSFESSKNCPVTMRSRGLSTGSVLVILLFVFSAIYLIGGAVALKVFRGAVGFELIPNYDFWSGLPALVRDGVTFTLSGCSAVSYERI